MKSNHQTYTRNPANMRHDAPSFQSLRSFTHQNPGETCRVDMPLEFQSLSAEDSTISFQFPTSDLPLRMCRFAKSLDRTSCPSSQQHNQFSHAVSPCFNCQLCVSKLHLIQILFHLGSISMIFYVFLTSSPFFTCPALGCRPFSLRQRPAPALLSARGANGIRMP